jgi:hypothetical protein
MKLDADEKELLENTIFALIHMPNAVSTTWWLSAMARRPRISEAGT